MILEKSEVLPLEKSCSRCCFSQAREAQSSESVLPVPVGDSSKAF
jgi:hypothetical protein